MSTKEQLLFSAVHGTAMRYAAERRDLAESITEKKRAPVLLTGALCEIGPGSRTLRPVLARVLCALLAARHSQLPIERYGWRGLFVQYPHACLLYENLRATCIGDR